MSLKHNKKKKQAVIICESSSSSASDDEDEELWYICLICNAAFENHPIIIKRHRKRVHSQQRSRGLILNKDDLCPSVTLTRVDYDKNKSTTPDKVPVQTPTTIDDVADEEIDDSAIPLPIPLKIEPPLSNSTTLIPPVPELAISTIPDHFIDCNDDNDAFEDAMAIWTGCFDNSPSDPEDKPCCSNLIPEFVLGVNIKEEINDVLGDDNPEEGKVHVQVEEADKETSSIVTVTKAAEKRGRRRRRGRPRRDPTKREEIDNKGSKSRNDRKETTNNSGSSNCSTICNTTYSQHSKLTRHYSSRKHADNLPKANTSILNNTTNGRPTQKKKECAKIQIESIDTPVEVNKTRGSRAAAVKASSNIKIYVDGLSEGDEEFEGNVEKTAVKKSNSNYHVATEQDTDDNSESYSDSSSSSNSINGHASNSNSIRNSTDEDKVKKPEGKSKRWKDSYPCLFCPCIFKDWRGLRSHMKEYRTSDENPPSATASSSVTSNGNPEQQTLTSPLPPPPKESNSEGFGNTTAADTTSDDDDSEKDALDTNTVQDPASPPPAQTISLFTSESSFAFTFLRSFVFLNQPIRARVLRI